MSQDPVGPPTLMDACAMVTRTVAGAEGQSMRLCLEAYTWASIDEAGLNLYGGVQELLRGLVSGVQSEEEAQSKVRLFTIVWWRSGSVPANRPVGHA